MNMLPESPMKMDAGLKLKIRNAPRLPASAMASTESLLPARIQPM
jgi:hypothetical protein